MHLYIFLQAEGNGFQVKYDHHTLTLEKAHELHPVIAQICAADSRESVVSALQAFRSAARNLGPSNNFLQSDKYLLQSDREDLAITLLHENAYDYERHATWPGAVHSESIESMIAFADGSDREKKGCCIL